MIKLPENVLCAMKLLKNQGFEAYAVGGAVRDSLMGREAEDFDITTSAFPEETKKVFSDFKVIETGIKHGTVTVLFDGEPLEITTFRIDGEYEDNRHPKSVKFTRNIKDDLSRRDFTINAIAYSPDTGIVDPFDGIADLKKGIIRTVGEADVRFKEDALRILRCVRFASTLSFDVDEKTEKSIGKNLSLIENVSKERIFAEMKKLLCGENVGKVFEKYSHVITKIVPELEKSIDFEQKSKYHIYDVYTHTYKALQASENNLLVRLALLYHDCGKPYVFTTDYKGFRHFVGHQQKSADLAEKSLLSLRCDRKTIDIVKKLVLYHDYKIEDNKKSVKRFLTKVSPEEAKLILKIKFADMYSHAEKYRISEDSVQKYMDIINEIEQNGECVTLQTMAVSGADLMEIGIGEGKKIGEILNLLLDEVVSENLPNEKSALLSYAEKLR